MGFLERACGSPPRNIKQMGDYRPYPYARMVKSFDIGVHLTPTIAGAKLIARCNLTVVVPN